MYNPLPIDFFVENNSSSFLMPVICIVTIVQFTELLWLKFVFLLWQLRFDVPKMYKFHKKKEVDIAVDLWRFVPARHQRST